MAGDAATRIRGRALGATCAAQAQTCAAWVPPRPAREATGKTILVVAGAEPTPSLVDELHARGVDVDAQVLVVVPVLASGLDLWTNDDRWRLDARAILERTTQVLAAAGIACSGWIADADARQALDDVLCSADVDEVVVIDSSSRSSSRTGHAAAVAVAGALVVAVGAIGAGKLSLLADLGIVLGVVALNVGSKLAVVAAIWFALRRRVLHQPRSSSARRQRVKRPLEITFEAPARAGERAGSLVYPYRVCRPPSSSEMIVGVGASRVRDLFQHADELDANGRARGAGSAGPGRGHDEREQTERTAYHEAGHAIVGMLTAGADPVRKVSITPRGMALGSPSLLPPSTA